MRYLEWKPPLKVRPSFYKRLISLATIFVILPIGTNDQKTYYKGTYFSSDKEGGGDVAHFDSGTVSQYLQRVYNTEGLSPAVMDEFLRAALDMKLLKLKSKSRKCPKLIDWYNEKSGVVIFRDTKQLIVFFFKDIKEDLQQIPSNVAQTRGNDTRAPSTEESSSWTQKLANIISSIKSHTYLNHETRFYIAEIRSGERSFQVPYFWRSLEAPSSGDSPPPPTVQIINILKGAGFKHHHVVSTLSVRSTHRSTPRSSLEANDSSQQPDVSTPPSLRTSLQQSTPSTSDKATSSTQKSSQQQSNQPLVFNQNSPFYLEESVVRDDRHGTSTTQLAVLPNDAPHTIINSERPRLDEKLTPDMTDQSNQNKRKSFPGQRTLQRFFGKSPKSTTETDHSKRKKRKAPNPKSASEEMTTSPLRGVSSIRVDLDRVATDQGTSDKEATTRGISNPVRIDPEVRRTIERNILTQQLARLQQKVEEPSIAPKEVDEPSEAPKEVNEPSEAPREAEVETEATQQYEKSTKPSTAPPPPPPPPPPRPLMTNLTPSNAIINPFNQSPLLSTALNNSNNDSDNSKEKSSSKRHKRRKKRRKHSRRRRQDMMYPPTPPFLRMAETSYSHIPDGAMKEREPAPSLTTIIGQLLTGSNPKQPKSWLDGFNENMPIFSLFDNLFRTYAGGSMI